MDQNLLLSRIHFKGADHSNLNRIDYEMQPNPMIQLSMGLGSEIKPVILKSSLEFTDSMQIDGYPLILNALINNDTSYFASSDEIVESWKITDSIILKNSPMFIYARGSVPKEEEIFMKKHNLHLVYN